MNFAQFLALSNIEKERVVFLEGTFQRSYQKEKTSCDIYRLTDFYVAFFYKLPSNQPATITGHYFSPHIPLDNHLDEIAASLTKRT